MIYQAITGERGVFSTQIAYVLRTGRSYQLQVADADGAGAQTLLRSGEPIISPAWARMAASWLMCRLKPKTGGVCTSRWPRARAGGWQRSGQ